MVKCGKWTFMSMQNRSVKFIALIAKHSVATWDDNHWMSLTRTRRIIFMENYAHYLEICVYGNINFVYPASVRYKHTNLKVKLWLNAKLIFTINLYVFKLLFRLSSLKWLMKVVQISATDRNILPWKFTFCYALQILKIKTQNYIFRLVFI